jgi:transcriptional regulator with XRE-family HTH domain/tetratricopeptide (TPR) repeat protein
MPAGQHMRDDFAALLLRLRRAAGLTQEDLATRAGLSERSIRDIERGRVRTPQRRTAAALADALRLHDVERLRFMSYARATRTHDEPESGRAPRIAVPQQLPPVLSDLTGRDGELDDLAGVAATVAAWGGAAPTVLAIHGPPGVGKTSLALAAGRRAVAAFPDGQLFVELRGTVGEPVDPGEVLTQFLRALDAAEDRIPVSLPERTARYRTLTQDRRLLVVLDNAADEGQVRPLLPAGAGCLVIVTSRRPLSGLAAVRQFALDVLPHADGGALLRVIVGRRAAEEPDSVGELVELCGRLPLALRIAGNRLASRPGWSVAHLVRRLRDQYTRLTALTAGDLSVRAAFAVSYQQLNATAALLFRRAAVVPGQDFSVDLLAAAADVARDVALLALEELVDAGLLGGTGERYSFHDLVRLYAEERLTEQEPADDVRAARNRTTTWLLDRTAEAGAVFDPEATADADHREAGAWLATEAAHWWPALRAAAQAGRNHDVVRTIRRLHWYSDAATHRHPWDEIFRLGVESARATGSRRDEAVLLNFLGWALYFCQDQNEAGLAAHTAALECAREIGDRREEAWALVYTGSIAARTGQPAAAAAACEQAISLFTALGYRAGEQSARGGLASALAALGRFDQALAIHQQLFADYQAGGDESPALVGQAATSLAIGHDLAGLDRWSEAAQAYARAADRFARSGTSYGEASAAYRHAMALRHLGDEPGARASLHRAIQHFAASHAPAWEAQAHAALAELENDRA